MQEAVGRGVPVLLPGDLRKGHLGTGAAAVEEQVLEIREVLAMLVLLVQEGVAEMQGVQGVQEVQLTPHLLIALL